MGELEPVGLGLVCSGFLNRASLSWGYFFGFCVLFGCCLVISSSAINCAKRLV